MNSVRQLPNTGSWSDRYRTMLDIAVWCGGMIVRPKPHQLQLRVDGVTAYPGDWIKADGNGFEVIPSRAGADL